MTPATLPAPLAWGLLFLRMAAALLLQVHGLPKLLHWQASSGVGG